MITNIKPEIIDAFDKIRKVYLLEKFDNLSESTEEILKTNLQNENFLIELKSTIDLIIESKFEDMIGDFEDIFYIIDFKEELRVINAYIIDLLKGDPDVENVKSFIIFDLAAGLLKFGWNYSFFKRDIDLVVGLFTAITSFSQEAIERQLKGLSVEGMEFKMIPFNKTDLAILFILNKEPSIILIKRMEQFLTEVERECGELFMTKDLDFTFDKNVQNRIFHLMDQILKFDVKKLIENKTTFE